MKANNEEIHWETDEKLVKQFDETPLEVLSKLREQGLENPMEMDEIITFISEVRKQR